MSGDSKRGAGPGEEQGPHTEQAEEVPARFDPEAFRFDWERACGRELEWTPGRRIRIYRPMPAKGQFVAAIVVVTLAFALIGGVFTGLLAGTEWVPAALAVALVVGLVAALVLAYVHREKEVVFDWSTRKACFREGRRERDLWLDEIDRIILQRRTRGRTGGSSTRQILHGCEVLAATTDGTEQVALSDFHLIPEVPYSLTEPMAAELAEALGVPCEENEHVSLARRLLRARTPRRR